MLAGCNGIRTSAAQLLARVRKAAHNRAFVFFFLVLAQRATFAGKFP